MDQGASSSGLIPRFAELIGRIKQAVAEGAGRDTRRLGVLSVLLWGYLGRTLLRLAALETRRAAGTLRPHAPADRKVRRGDDPVIGSGGTSGAAAARIPYGPVLLRFQAAHLALALERLVAEPETEALLAAAPQAGRVLRPLWRMLSTDPLPRSLRLPPRPRRARTAIAPEGIAPVGTATREAVPPPKRHRHSHRTSRGAWWTGPPSSRIAMRPPRLPDW